MNMTIFRSVILGCAAITTIIGCDTSSDIQSLRSEQTVDNIWLSSDRPIVEDEPVSFGLAVSSQPTPAPIMNIDRTKVCDGVKFRNAQGDGVVGTGKNCSISSCSADGATGCKVEGSYEAVNVSAIEFDKVEVGFSIAGQPGTFDANDPKYNNCEKTGDKNCTATAQFFAVNEAWVNKSTIKNGETLGSIQGEYPSIAYPLSGEKGDKKELTTANVDSALSDQSSSYYYFSRDGVVKDFKADPKFKEENVLTGKKIYKVDGKAPVATSKKCLAVGDSDCFIEDGGSFVAINKDDLTPGKIKKGIKVAGVMGTFPSAATPLNLGSGRTEFGMGLIATNNAFSIFTKEGARIEVSGDAQLANPDNIRDGKTIFGTTGKLDGFDFAAIRPIDVRAGVDIPNTAKKGTIQLQVNCASAADCVGADKPWQDVTQAVSSGTMTCTSNQDYCVIRNQTQQLDWAFHLKNAKKNWTAAVTHCKDLAALGDQNWRLPTQKEAQIAAAQSLNKLGHYAYYENPGDLNRGFWTSTANYQKNSASATPDTDWKISYRRFDNKIWSEKFDKTYDVTCVREVAP